MSNKLRIGKIIMTDSMVLTEEMAKGDYESGQAALKAYENQGGWPAVTAQVGTDDDQIQWAENLLENGRPRVIVRGIELFRLNDRCQKCSACSEVNEHISGKRMEQNEKYYQCLPGIESDCLGEEYVTGCYTKWGEFDIQSKNCLKCSNCVGTACIVNKVGIKDTKAALTCDRYDEKGA